MKPRLSVLRQEILALFNTPPHLPLCAQDIHAHFPEVHKTSIYRALDYLQQEGLLESFVLPCSQNGIQTYYLSSRNHAHFFHCEVCHRFFPLRSCPIPPNIFDRPYEISQHVFYLLGTCPDCLTSRKNSVDDTAKDHTDE